MLEPTPLSPKIRWQAVGCFVAGCLYPIVASPAIARFLIGILSPQSLSSLPFLSRLTTPAIWAGLLVGILAPLLTWLWLRKTHPFVDSSGKTAVNLLLNFVMWSVSIILLIFFALNIVCGKYSGLLNLLDVGVLLSSPFLASFMLTYFVLSIVGAWRAYHGQLSSFPLFRFIKVNYE